jgi:molecular chaperone GrpE
MERNEQEPQERGDLPEVSGQVIQGEVVQEEEEPLAVVADEAELQLSEAQQKAEEYLDLLRRTQADFVNYRRRMNQEQAEARTTAQLALLNQLLPVLDDFERALDATPEDLARHPWVQGLFLVARRLTALLDQLGVEQIGEPGEQFDPRRHEALSLEARADAPEGTILQVARPGYVLGERVIRPAQVIVAGAPSSVVDAPST